MFSQHLKVAGILIPLAAVLSGCAATPAVPADPAQMTVYQRIDAGYGECVRWERQGKKVQAFPRQEAVILLEESFDYTWYCRGADGKPVPAKIVGQPLAPEDQPGNGVIGASMEQTEAGIVFHWLAPEGSATADGRLAVGDLLLTVRETPESPAIPVRPLPLNDVSWLIRGQPGTDVEITVQSPSDGATKVIQLTRARGTKQDLTLLKAHLEKRAEQAALEARNNLVIQDNSGQFMSPYTQDRVTAEWVNKAINANMGATAGSAVGAAAGAYAANKALESVPFGSVLGGFIGSSVGKNIGRSGAIESIGGWQYVRATSDMSFRSLTDMAQYLKAEFANDPNFADVVKATSQIYPEFSAAFAAEQ